MLTSKQLSHSCMELCFGCNAKTDPTYLYFWISGMLKSQGNDASTDICKALKRSVRDCRIIDILLSTVNDCRCSMLSE